MTPGEIMTDDIDIVREALTGSVLGGYFARRDAALAALDRLAAQQPVIDAARRVAKRWDTAPAMPSPALLDMVLEELSDAVAALAAASPEAKDQGVT